MRDLRNALVGTVVVLGGLALAGVTFYAHQMNEPRIAGFAAIASLVFVLLILIFVVPPLARNASREASQMNLPFEFTVGGAIALGLIAIIGFSAWNTGNNLIFLILSFLASAVVVSFFAGSYCLKKLDVKMRFPETIFAGEETHIFVSVANRKRLFPSFSVVVEVRGKEREESVAAEELKKLLPGFVAKWLAKPPIIRRTLDHIAYIPRSSSIETRTGHVFNERGRFLIKDFELSTRFPFGFFRHRRRLPAKETELIVFPAFEPIKRPLDRLPLESGSVEALRRGLGHDLFALRDYRSNDDLRRVDWKATARTTQLTVREFTAEDDKKVTIIFDTRMPSGEKGTKQLRDVIEAEQKGGNAMRSERFESGVIMAAALLSYFTKDRAELRLVTGNEIGEFGIGSRHLHDSLKRLAIVEPVFSEARNGRFDEMLSEIAISGEKSHNLLLTAGQSGDLDGETAAKLYLITL